MVQTNNAPEDLKVGVILEEATREVKHAQVQAVERIIATAPDQDYLFSFAVWAKLSQAQGNLHQDFVYDQLKGHNRFNRVCWFRIRICGQGGVWSGAREGRFALC
jgi:hypothetical protein